MKRLLALLLLLPATALAAVLLVTKYVAPQQGGGASSTGRGSCTDGTDCYCDCVADGSGAACLAKFGADITDASLLFCEDTEKPTYYADGADAWYVADTYRGHGSAWVSYYGNAVNSCLGWDDGQPSSPRLGITCNAPGTYCGSGEWCSAAQGNVVDSGGIDCWESNGTACIDIYRAAEAESAHEVDSSLIMPTVFDGNQSLFELIQIGSTAGNMGAKNFSASAEIGVTLAVFFPTNLYDSNILKSQWKFDEYPENGDAWVLGHSSATCAESTCPNEEFPFNGFIFVQSPYWWTSDGGNNYCVTAAANATKTVGDISCDTAYHTVPGGWDANDDLTLGEWFCVRAHMTGGGTSDGSIELWFNQQKVLDISELDLSIVVNPPYSGYSFADYSNYEAYEGDLAHATGRAEDNIHVRAGSPVSCSQIGFL